VLIEHLLEAGCQVHAYDPVAMPETKRKIGDAIHYCTTIEEAISHAEALLLVTEWHEFRTLNPQKLITLMKHPVLFDGRNIYDSEEMHKAGVTYFGIGR
jgi:UDPglucose 6-dehydrogenase